MSFCPGDTAILNLSQYVTDIKYHWIPQTYISDTTANFPVIRPVTSGSYTVVGTSIYGCTDTASFNVFVHPAAILFIGDSTTLYPGETYQISSQSNCTFFSWFPSYGLNDPTSSNPIASPEMSTKYVVTGKTEWGCIAKDSISIYVDGESIIAAPNAFTPGKGPNSEFKILKRGIVSLNYLRIFNRWGNLIFETTNIDEGWDGNYKGAAQPFDTYVYLVQVVTSTGKLVNKQGNITLIR